jgi:hypothetical protein
MKQGVTGAAGLLKNAHGMLCAMELHNFEKLYHIHTDNVRYFTYSYVSPLRPNKIGGARGRQNVRVTFPSPAPILTCIFVLISH